MGRYLLWSDIPNDVQMRWLEEDGHVSTFRHPSGNSNGNTFDYQGRQIACEHGNRRVVRYEYNGKITVLADKFAGKQFNAPNDAVVHPNDGAIWFTDPGYGSRMNYEGHRANTGSVQPFQKEAIYRIDDKTGKIAKVADEIHKPNGLCFSPGEKKLYVVDSFSKPVSIRAYDVVDGGAKLANGSVFFSCGEGEAPDGIRCDVDGNLWCSANAGVNLGYSGVTVWSPQGELIGRIRLPEVCANVCFGGPARNRLFMVASQSLYAVYLSTQGAAPS